jgi:N-(2-amino-2-carboxyethyl)-L-glutamate synthase
MLTEVKEGILAAIGRTPLIRLRRMFANFPFQVFAKLEAANPGGSVKDRPALEMIRHAIEAGSVNRDTVIVESSSGNLAIGLAQVCCYFGLRLICVLDSRAMARNIEILRALGAHIEMVSEPDPVSGEFLQARLQRVKDILKSIPNAYWPNQYANERNAQAHFRSTMPEIVEALGGDPDYLFCATSTCGAVVGCSEYARRHGLRTKIIAVDAKGSVIFGGRKGPRKIPGHGAGIRPAICDYDAVDRCIYVSDMDCIRGCRMLAKCEGILAGGSSGAVLMAIVQMRDQLPPGANCVGIFPDRGERYLETIFSDAWVESNFGRVPDIAVDSMKSIGA